MASINSKRDFYELFQKGLLGNKPKTYNSLEEILTSDYSGYVSIRSRTKPSFKTLYDIAYHNIENTLNRFELNPNEVSLTEQIPDDKIIIQGEIMLSSKHYDLTYSTIKEPMKLALAKESIFVQGLKALNIIKNAMNINSYNDLQELFILYPDSIIEFGSYEICLGDKKDRNTLIWEVRNY